MGLISLLGKIAEVIKDDITTPESFKLGEAFEDYVRETLFIDRYYTLVDRAHNYKTNKKDYIEASLKPDFLFRDHITNKEFYVEAKVRTTVYDGKIIWCNHKQLYRYNEYHKHKPVFLILDVGDEDRFLSLIPLDKAKYIGLFPSYARKFEIEPNKPVSSKVLWNR